jgi:hypothetical protein
MHIAAAMNALSTDTDSHPEDRELLATPTFHEWWLSQPRSSLAPTEADIEPAPDPVAKLQSAGDTPQSYRAKLAFMCATGLFWGAALMTLVDGERRSEVEPAVAPRTVSGMVEIGEIQVLNAIGDLVGVSEASSSPVAAMVEIGEIQVMNAPFASRPAVAKLAVSPRTVTALPNGTQATVAAPAFNRAAAARAVETAAAGLSACSDGEHRGSSRVSVTFAPSGDAISASVEGGDLGGNSVGSCVARHMRSVRVPAFTGSRVTVRKTVHVR